MAWLQIRVLFLLGPLPWASSFAIPCLSRLLSSRCYSRRCRGLQLQQQLHPSNCREGDLIAAANLYEERDECRYRVATPWRMVPLSHPPLLLLQSPSPIISREGCSLLSQYFDNLEANGADAHCVDETRIHMAKSLLHDIHDVVDKVTNCPRHDGEMQMPRYVRYVPTIVDDRLLLDTEKLEGALLPDGLHVDTNNGKLFRHVTAILYLTDSGDGSLIDKSSGPDGRNADGPAFVVGGGTTFPLAVPLHEKEKIHERTDILDAARGLLERGIHHTKGDVGGGETSDGRILERAGVGVFRRDNSEDPRGGRLDNCASNSSGGDGVRVMPEAGKLIYFHNVADDGSPEPASFHGGEELITTLPASRRLQDGGISSTKSILAFFKEIPIEAFLDRGRVRFAECAKTARCWTKETYY